MLPLERFLTSSPPRLALGRFPSPVETHQGLARAWGFSSFTIKREDQNADSGPGGNKLRALEWILPSAAPWIVSTGGFGSNYAAALSFYAGRCGRQVALALFPQPWLGSVPATLSATASRADVFLARQKWQLPFAVWRAWRHASRRGPATWVPAGGASPLGVLGSVNAALEFWEQVQRAEAPRPDLIVAPLGSGGTVAGLLLGSWLAGQSVTVGAVRVADPIIANRWQVNRLVMRTRNLLHTHGLAVRPGLARLRILTNYLGAGYGVPTPEGRSAAGRLADHGLTLELTYGAKAFAAIESLAASYHAPCFWHTFDPRITDGSEETPLLRTARRYAESLWPQQKST